MMLIRRSLLKSAAAAGGLSMPFVHGAYAAGKLSCGFWDGWVQGANEPLAKLCREWADREKVEITIEFITSQGDKLALTATAEGQVRSGHESCSSPIGMPPLRPTISSRSTIW